MEKSTASFNTEGRYPTGDSSFSNIREKGQIYVDKTDLIYKMTHHSQYYFLSRPRRFGKSLMLSTLKAYFEGRKELFEGLAISNLEKEWKWHPVIRLSMGGEEFSSVDILKYHLTNTIGKNESALGIVPQGETPASRFGFLIENAVKKYGEKVVILIDEYDKPLLDTQFEDDGLHNGCKNAMRGFYSVIKENADYLRFVMLTGVTKFSQLNLFSGLNNLMDISLDLEYNALCGISESEMHSYFVEDMKVFAAWNKLTEEQSWAKFKTYYDGYHFAGQGEDIYNPYSVLMAFSKMKLGNYWYQTGNTKHLFDALINDRRFNFEKVEGVLSSEEEMMDTNVSYRYPIALLYQTGYLTIKEFDDEEETYTLGLPNKEVSASFYNCLMAALATKDECTNPFSSIYMVNACKRGDAEELMKMLNAGLVSFKYDQLKEPTHEMHFHAMLHIMCMCAGLRVESEVQTTNGRIDMVLKTRRYIYIVEFKVDKSVEEAVEQMQRKDYAAKYRYDKRTLIQIGANFSTETRLLTGWQVWEQ